MQMTSNYAAFKRNKKGIPTNLPTLRHRYKKYLAKFMALALSSSQVINHSAPHGDNLGTEQLHFQQYLHHLWTALICDAPPDTAYHQNDV